MKKILLTLAILILGYIAYTIVAKSLSIGSLKLESYQDIVDASEALNNKYESATDLVDKQYPQEKRKLDTAINTFTTTKEDYDNRTKYDTVNAGAIEVEVYKIEFLWAMLGNYASKRGTILTLDIKQGVNEGLYDLAFTVTGSYGGITEFISDVEGDAKLGYRIDNFSILPKGVAGTTNTNATGASTTDTTTPPTLSTSVTGGVQEQNNQTTTTATETPEYTGDTSVLQATFDVVDVNISLNQ